MSKIPLFYTDDEFFNEFGTSCYINHEQMVDAFPIYRHNFIEISLVLEGAGTEIINGVSYQVAKNSMSVTMPWHFHTLCTEPENSVTRFICEFSMEDYLQYASIWSDAQHYLFNKSLPTNVKLDDEAFDEACNIFNAMYSCFTSNDDDKQVRLYLHLIQIMMLFSKEQRRTLAADNLNKPTKSSNEDIVTEAIRYIHYNYSRDITLSIIGKELGVSASALREQLFAYTGQKFGKLLSDIRVRNACVLLALKTPTIKYIAQNTGFQSLQTFYRTFKDIKGVTPETYRKQHWQESEGKAGYIMYNNQVWDVLFYIHKYFDDPITPESVANSLGMSVSYLHKIVKFNFMQTFSELLREIRVGYSCGFLRSTDVPVAQIALEVGYNNTKTFSSAFYEQLSCSPNEYRERFEKNKVQRTM